MSSINIEEIMAQIKQDIKDKGLTSDMLSFEDVPYRGVQAAGSSGGGETAFAYINSRYYIQPYKGNPVKIFFKKVIRKLIKFYVEPVVFEQDDFNANVVTAMNSLRSQENDISSSELLDRIETLELANKELMKRLEKLENISGDTGSEGQAEE